MKIYTPPRLLVLFVSLVTNLIEGLLGIRIVLKLFGASTSAPFVRWIYETSQSLLTPFGGIFPTPSLVGGFVIEFSSIFALLVYTFIGYLLVQAIETLMFYDDQRDKHSR